MIQLDQLTLPTPAACSVEIQARGGSEKYNTLGQLVPDHRMEKRTLDMRWHRMDRENLQRLFTLLDSGVFFDLTYPDPVAGEKTITCRCTARGARVWQYTGEAAWADVHLKLEER